MFDERDEWDLAQERDLFRAAFDGSFDAIVIADNEGRYVEVNESATELFGCPKAELLGRSIRDFAPADFDFETAWQAFRESGVERGEFPLVRTDGAQRLIEYAATGNIVSGRHVSVLRDVTERERQTQKLREQNERLAEFAGVLSHDIRNPLNVAQGRLELAREEHDSDHHEVISTALDRIERIVDDMLDLARDEKDIDVTEPIALDEAVAAAWAMVTDDADQLTIDLEGSGGRMVVRADPNRLQQLLENLFRNSVEHGEAGVTVRVGVLEDGFYIEDTGSGIPPDTRATLFEDGHRSPDGKIGFGLRIVKKIVDAHGWDLRVVDGNEHGTRFEITNVDLGPA
jgi:PAS domain S-box-containing protein